MPIDLEHGRHGKGNHGTIAGEDRILHPWNCPACGKKNEGRRPEQGCGHCGAGDPTTNPPRQEQPPVDALADADPVAAGIRDAITRNPIGKA